MELIRRITRGRPANDKPGRDSSATRDRARRNYSVNQHSLKIIRRIVSSYNVDARARARASQTYRQLYIKKGREGETSKLKGAITVKFLSSARESRDKAAR